MTSDHEVRSMSAKPANRWKGPTFLVPVVMLLMGGCLSLSKEVVDKSAGLNGGFEISKDGLPVNWAFYTPSSADFDVILDEEISKEGKQSLRFDVRRCSAKGGSRSPGLANEFSQIGKYPGEGRYKVSFWIRNAGTEFAIKAGGVSATAGDMRTLIREDQNIEE